ncbi:MAG: hypothetical protein IKX03_05510 [Bacteroidales bacterium]|nr:hypothetical protein [Bacteroidales bacterium]
MKKLFLSLLFAAVALLPTACESDIPNVPDLSGTLYGTWVLDTKTVDVVTTTDGKTETNQDVTDFTNEHFLLHLTDFFVAFAQEGTLLTFDIDDVDGVKYTYNDNLKQIYFEKLIVLNKGFFNAKTMSLFGKYDVIELSDTKLVLKKVEETTLGSTKTTTTTVYSYHRLAS